MKFKGNLKSTPNYSMVSSFPPNVITGEKLQKTC